MHVILLSEPRKEIFGVLLFVANLLQINYKSEKHLAFYLNQLSRFSIDGLF